MKVELIIQSVTPPHFYAEQDVYPEAVTRGGYDEAIRVAKNELTRSYGAEDKFRLILDCHEQVGELFDEIAARQGAAIPAGVGRYKMLCHFFGVSEVLVRLA